MRAFAFGGVLVALLVLTAGCMAGRDGSPAPMAVSTSPLSTSMTPTVQPTAEAPVILPTVTHTAEPTPAVLIAAGDVAGCDSRGDETTAAIVEGLPGVVAVLGDTAYPGGSASDFTDCYEPTWGRFKDRTRPAVGNHEYLTTGAAGYFGYFGPAAGDPAQGYYSYDLGKWHVAVINSQCWEVGGCGRGDAQAVWLESDLAANPTRCTLAYWHTPRFSSGLHGSSDLVDAYWDVLYAAGAEIVLTGHDHSYERFAPQDDQGRSDPERGLREFVVGTGGFYLYSFPGEAIANSEVRQASSIGVLVLTLFEDRYDWQFVPADEAGFRDEGGGPCHD